MTITTISKPFTCRDCGQTFQSEVLVIGTKERIAPTVCDACCRALEAIGRGIREKMGARERAEKQEAANRLWERLCPWEFRTVEEGGNTDIAKMDRRQPEWREVLAWSSGRRGLILRSKVSGSCKTRAMWRLLRRLFDIRVQFIAVTAAEFDRGCRDAGGNFTLSQWFSRLADTDVLFIDDLGKGAWTPHTEGTFFDLVDERTKHGRPILVTTNEDGESLSHMKTKDSIDRAGPMVRRLRDYCDVIVFQ